MRDIGLGWKSVSCQSSKLFPFYWFNLTTGLFFFILESSNCLFCTVQLPQCKSNILKCLLTKYQQPVYSHWSVNSYWLLCYDLLLSSLSRLKWYIRVSVTPHPEITHSVPLLKDWFGRQAVFTKRVSLAQYGLSVTLSWSMAAQKSHRTKNSMSVHLIFILTQ